ncbi:calcium-binding protein [Tateyamaria sp. syn59]|uniref:calcium-binding protein n=1 Tax=Tateyamaria sp. syn59 TaxID=2576942 RepID=UPI001675E3FA|nr:hypothetical protein [Tateyamaria sp. syn59]
MEFALLGLIGLAAVVFGVVDDDDPDDQNGDAETPVPESGAGGPDVPDIVVDGTAQADELIGGSVDEFIRGFAGNDTIDAGAGDDRVAGGQGEDSLIGGNGNDTLLGSLADDTLEGGAGDDVLDGGFRWDRLLGGDGDDLLLGGPGNDSLDGGDGDDTIDGGEGSGFIRGGEGDDLIYVGTDYTGLDFRSGQVISGPGDDTVYAGLGQDEISTGLGDDVIFVTDNDGNVSGQREDFVTPGPGADHVIVTADERATDTNGPLIFLADSFDGSVEAQDVVEFRDDGTSAGVVSFHLGAPGDDDRDVLDVSELERPGGGPITEADIQMEIQEDEIAPLTYDLNLIIRTGDEGERVGVILFCVSFEEYGDNPGSATFDEAAFYRHIGLLAA